MILEHLKPKTKVGQNDSVFQFRVFCISAYLLVPHELFQPSIRAIAWLLVSTNYCSGSQFLCRRKLLFSRDAQGNPLLENQQVSLSSLDLTDMSSSEQSRISWDEQMASLVSMILLLGKSLAPFYHNAMVLARKRTGKQTATQGFFLYCCLSVCCY